MTAIAGEAFEYRPHQEEARDGITQARQNGATRMLLDMATGLGKTEVAIGEIERVVEQDNTARVIYLCNRIGVLRDAQAKLERRFGGDVNAGLLTGTPLDDDRQVLFGSLQTMGSRREGRKVFESFAPDTFKLAVGDEGHYGQARTYKSVFDHFTPEQLLGMTATPYRLDGRPVSEIFGKTVYRKTLPKAMAEGLLAPMVYTTYADKIIEGDSLEELAEQTTLGELNRSVFMPHRDEEMIRLIGEELEQLDNPHGLIFCKTIAHAEHIAEIATKRLPYKVGTIHSKQKPDLHDRLDKAFYNGDLQIATVVGEYDEGRDVPGLNFIAFTYDTTSEGRWLQRLGRGVRDDTPVLRVADFSATLESITMINQLSKAYRGEKAKLPDIPSDKMLPAAEFIFKNRVQDLPAVAHTIRARNQTRQVEILAERQANKAAQVQAEVEQDKPRFLPIAEALDAGFALADYPKWSRTQAGLERTYKGTLHRWVFECRRLESGKPYQSHNNKLNEITAMMVVGDTNTGEQVYYSIDANSAISRVDSPETWHRGDFDLSLFGGGMSDYRDGLRRDLQVSEPSEEETRRIEALLNLGLPDGVGSSSATFEDIAYQSALAARFGSMCLRATEELADAHTYNGTVLIPFGEDHIIEIQANERPAVDFPGATWNDRYLANIMVCEKVAATGERKPPTANFLLLGDGSVVSFKVINTLSKSRNQYYIGLNSYITIPNSYLAAEVSPVHPETLTPILDAIEAAVGPSVDWKNMDIDTVLKTAQTVLDLPDGIFSRQRATNFKKPDLAKRGLALMLLRKKGIASTRDIANHTGINIRSVRASIKLSQDRSLYGYHPHEKAHGLYAALINALPHEGALAEAARKSPRN